MWFWLDKRGEKGSFPKASPKVAKHGANRGVPIGAQKSPDLEFIAPEKIGHLPGHLSGHLSGHHSGDHCMRPGRTLDAKGVFPVEIT